MDEVNEEAEVLVDEAMDALDSYPDEAVAERAKHLLLARLQGN